MSEPNGPVINFRDATPADLPAIVDLLADDEMGARRETTARPLDPAYALAFRDIAWDPNNLLVVAAGGDDQILGGLQLTFIPGLARMGAMRGQIEGVRIARSHRNAGLGARMFEWAIAACRKRGCGLVQLTSDWRREGAHRFYEKLGFEPSHVGYKLTLRRAQ